MSEQEHHCADRIRGIPQSSTVMIADMAAALRANGEDVIDLSAGRASEATPVQISEAAKAALDDGDTHQTPARGKPEYLSAVAEKLHRENGLSVDPQEGVIATLGCKNGLVLSLMSLLDPGDEVIIENPCFVSYAPTITLCGGRPVPVNLDPQNGYRWHKDQLAAAVTPRTRAILLCSPHNPLGVVHTRGDLQPIAALAQEHDLFVIADEIYEAVTWGGRKHCPIASLPGMADRTVGLMGMTKSYSMGGWRIGYAYGPPEIIRHMTTVQAHFMTCASSIHQRAGTAALSDSITGELRRTVWPEWEGRCQFLSGALNGLNGVSCSMPEGGFYAWLDISETGLDSMTFCERLLMDEKVATVPGKSFGHNGEGWVRITCVKSRPDIIEAAARMAEFTEALSKR